VDAVTTPEILYLDNHLVVAVKPPGILSQADGSMSPDMLSLLKEEIRLRFAKPGQVFLGLVHRLDQPVGGVMVFARTSKAASRLSRQIRERTVIKDYLAVVSGRPEPERGTLADTLVKDRSRNLVQVAKPGDGKEAWLNYCRIASLDSPTRSLLAIRLGTGRAHQIRVQLSSRQWPLLGDRKYGPKTPDLPRLDNLALFACGIGLKHPTRQEPLYFSALPPREAPWTDFEFKQLPDIASLWTDQSHSQNVHEETRGPISENSSVS